MGSSRQSMLTSWLASNSFDKDSISVLSADASFRQYYRATKSDTSYAVMDCPPEKENLESFLLITEKLKNAKLNVPEIFDVDKEKGFLIMTDLGDNLYSKKLNDETVYCLYTDALEAIVKMQTKVDCSELKDFDKYYEHENNLFTGWFLKKHLKTELDAVLEKEITLEFNKIN